MKQSSIVLEYPEGHFLLKEGEDEIMITKNLRYSFMLSEDGIEKIEDRLTGRVFSMKPENE